MAAGDLTVFEEFAKNIGDGTHDLDNDTIKMALITSGTVPTASDATPALGDYTEVTPGGNYSAGGPTLTVTYSEAGGVASLNVTAQSTTITKAAGSPTNGAYALVYNDTPVGDPAIAFVDLGGNFDLVNFDLTVNWGTGGTAGDILATTVS